MEKNVETQKCNSLKFYDKFECSSMLVRQFKDVALTMKLVIIKTADSSLARLT